MSGKADQGIELVNIEVDGVAMEVPKNSMIIEATDKAGIEIPRFCYHEKLSIAANCRMCLVDVEKAPKPLPACATPVMDGMRVFTRSRRAVDAQHGVMEFLLINHPLDCPICDQGGECELQDLAMGYGRSVSRFTERKRVVKDKNVGPLVQTDMTRCIHCTRCIRFLDEIAGTNEMGGTGRGDRLEIGTCIERSIDSELSGNIIDLCPVGALTNKPFRFSARAWEMVARPSQAAHDAVCSTLYYHSHRGRIKRAVPRQDERRNETWLSDRDRYSHFGLYAQDRVLEPRIRVGGAWQSVSWDEAIAATAVVLKEAGESLQVLMGASSATEEYFLAQRLARALGSDHIDHRLRERDFTDDPARPTAPTFEMPLADVQEADAIMLLGSNIRHEAPIIGHGVRQAWRSGGAVMALNPVDWDFHFELEHKRIVAPQLLLRDVIALSMAVADASGQALPQDLASLTAGIESGDDNRAMAQCLVDAGRCVVLLGQFAHSHPQAAALRRVARWIADATGSALNVLPFGGNPVGAWLAGALPHRGPGGIEAGPGRTVADMLESEAGTFLVWEFEPPYDTFDAARTRRVLGNADKVVAVSSFAGPELEELADVILPLAPLLESEGTLHNIDGTAMTFGPAGHASGASKPGWKILRRLGGELDLDGFGQVDLAELQQEMATALGGKARPSDWALETAEPESGLFRVGEIPMYSVDALCRRSAALQQTSHADTGYVGLNAEDVEDLGLQDGVQVTVAQNGASVALPARVLGSLPRGAVWLPGATRHARELGALVGPLTVEKA